MALRELVAGILDVPASDVDDTTCQESIDSWDSLAHIELITTVEETYQVFLSTDEMGRARSFAELRRILMSKGAEV